MAPLMPTIYKSTALRSFGTRAWFPRLERPRLNFANVSLQLLQLTSVAPTAARTIQ